MADPVSIAGLAVSAASLVVSAPGAGIAIASLTGKNSSEYLTYESFEKMYENIPKEVIKRMWKKYSDAKESVETWKNDYGYGVSCKMLFTNATDRTVHRGPIVSIFMGKKTDDKMVHFFPSISPGETFAAFHAKRDGAAVGCGGGMEFYLEGLKDQPWWAVGWKVPYSGDNATHSRVATCKEVSEYLEKKHVVGDNSTTFSYEEKYRLDTLISTGTTAVHHIILRKVK